MHVCIFALHTFYVRYAGHRCGACHHCVCRATYTDGRSPLSRWWIHCLRHLVEDIMFSDAVMGLRDAESLTIARVEIRCDDGVSIFIYSTTQYLTHCTNISNLSLRQLKCQLLNSRRCSKASDGTRRMPKS